MMLIYLSQHFGGGGVGGFLGNVGGEAFGSVESSSRRHIGGALGGYFASMTATGGGNLNCGVAFGESSFGAADTWSVDVGMDGRGRGCEAFRRAASVTGGRD